MNRVISWCNQNKPRFLSKHKPSLMKTEDKRYGHNADGPSGYYIDMFDARFVGTLYWVKERVNEGSIPLWYLWWIHRLSILIATVAGTEGWEYSEVLMDKYVHEQNIHDRKTGCCHWAEERKISKELVGHVVVQDKA